MSEFQKRNWCLFTGSLWGLTEATLGYGLHLLPFTIGWLIWFPLAYYFMARIYRETGKVRYVIMGAGITSLIKSVNIFMDPRLDHTLNPIISILTEAGAYSLVIFLGRNLSWKNNLAGVIFVNILWRAGYLCYMSLMPKSFISISPLKNGNALFFFYVIETIFTSGLVMAGMLIRDLLKLSSAVKKAPNLFTSGAVFVLAVLASLVL